MTLAPESLAPESPLRKIAERLQAQLNSKRDLMADTRRVSFVADGEGKGGGLTFNVDAPEGAEAFGVTRHAHQQVADHLDVTWKLYDRLLGKHPDLLAGLANGLLSREPAKRMIRTLDGNMRAFLSDRYRPRDNWDLMEQAVLPTLGQHPGNVNFRKCELTETRMYVKVSLPQFELPVTPREGDVIHGGVIIQNSEVGDGSLGIWPYTTRLICTNGMVHTEYGQRRVHVSKRISSDEEVWELYSDETLRLDDEAFFAKCRDTIAAVLNETVFQAIVGQMQELAAIKPEGAPDKVVEVFSKKHGLTGEESGSMLAALIEGADLSAWGYVNALTQTARDLENADRQVELEKLAGGLTSDPTWTRALAGATV